MVTSITRRYYRAGRSSQERSGSVTLIPPGADAIEIPRQQLVDAADRVVGEPSTHRARRPLRAEPGCSRRGQALNPVRD